jgi:uncharacterized membrane protein YedE/YeeE
LGVVLFLAFLLTGHGLGASGGFARVAAAVMNLVVPDQIRLNPYLSHYATAPLQHWIVPLLVGVALGGFTSGKFAGRCRVETLRGPNISVQSRWILAFSGGIIAGFGARLARGCTSGQALSGGATLAVGSWAFMLAAFAGGYAVAWMFRKAWN